MNSKYDLESLSWEERYWWEINRATEARSHGNEGMARVCARRAAGVVLKEFYAREGLPPVGSSAYDRLEFLQSYPAVSERVREVASHFTLRITPEHELPGNVDLVAEARWLARALLGDEPDKIPGQ